VDNAWLSRCVCLPTLTLKYAGCLGQFQWESHKH
jgi:hypothetical protein